MTERTDPPTPVSAGWLSGLVLEPGDRLVRVKSWVPFICDGRVNWPVLLHDGRGGQRVTASPVWDMARLRTLWGRIRGR